MLSKGYQQKEKSLQRNDFSGTYKPLGVILSLPLDVNRVVSTI